jgi:hypothetical protein
VSPEAGLKVAKQSLYPATIQVRLGGNWDCANEVRRFAQTGHEGGVEASDRGFGDLLKDRVLDVVGGRRSDAVRDGKRGKKEYETVYWHSPLNI